MKVLAVNTSVRKDGNTASMLNMVLAELEREGIETELVQTGAKSMPGCIACYKCKENQDGRCSVKTDGLNEILEKMVEADGILLGSPTYFADVTSNMKSLIDRAGMTMRVNGHLLKHKVGAAVVPARRGGAIHAFDTINHFFTISQMIIPGSSYWNIGHGRNPGEVNNDEEGVQTMKDLGQNMAWLLKKIHG